MDKFEATESIMLSGSEANCYSCAIPKEENNPENSVSMMSREESSYPVVASVPAYQPNLPEFTQEEDLQALQETVAKLKKERDAKKRANKKLKRIIEKYTAEKELFLKKTEILKQERPPEWLFKALAEITKGIANKHKDGMKTLISNQQL